MTEPGRPAELRTPAWHIAIDRGGTFTDGVLTDADGRVRKAIKVRSGPDAIEDCARALLECPRPEPIPPGNLRVATTLATNALLERRVAPTGLIITRGFGDLLAIGDQTRPDLFSLERRRPPPLVEAVFEVPTRACARGEVLAAADLAAVDAVLALARARGLESLAIVIVFGHLVPALEREIAGRAHEAGFVDVVCSHEAGSADGLLRRAETAVVDAALAPILRRGIADLAVAFPGSCIEILQSSGDLCPPSRLRGRDAVLSGPAGGVLAVAEAARTRSIARAIGLDMGGTSTDVFRYEGAPAIVFGREIAGLRVHTRSVAVHTVAAGGGSLCRLEGATLTVGPDSAGASPGPLCYGAPEATTLALTDINLALGRVDPERFPIPLSRARVDAALADQVESLTRIGVQSTSTALADGWFRVAVEQIAEAIRRITVAEGHDVREHTLVVFGGAGGQHACAVARRLGIRSLLFPPLAGALSACGLARATAGWHGQARLAALAHQLDVEALWRRVDALIDEGRHAIAADTRAHADRDLDAPLDVEVMVTARYRGADATFEIDLAPLRRVPGLSTAIRSAFEHAHARSLQWTRTDAEVELDVLHVRMARPGSKVAAAGTGAFRERANTAPVRARGLPLRPRASIDMWMDGEPIAAVPVFDREDLEVGAELEGPAVIREALATIVIERGFFVSADAGGALVCEDRQHARPSPTDLTTRDPVLSSVFAHRFMAIAEQMGTALARTATSTNIRERHDFSCGVFDATAGLVANAPHIPVHLGAMSESVRAVIAAHPQPTPGDAFLTNDPDAGGSHLPDLTVVTPVFDDRGQLRFWVASRGHHADVGGITPGSMPATSTSIDEEGVVFRCVPIARGGLLDEADARARLTAGPWPARRPDENIADLRAQLAANWTGAQLLLDLCRSWGDDVVEAYMGHVQTDAALRVRQAIAAVAPASARFDDALDDGTPICVDLSSDAHRLVIDLSRSGDAHPGNLNAPRAVCVAAVLYVLRCLVDRPIPLNRGCLEPIDLRLRKGSILWPDPGRAVAAGNVETAQRVVDVLLGALGRCAASQGTMNNLTLGDADFGYYETLGGGTGASARGPGASAVHSHMTNTRITDVEVLEARVPVRVREFSIRAGSGGAGLHRGGDGLVRELEVLRRLVVTVVSERRTRAPFGLQGGGPGQPGRNRVFSAADGRWVELGGRATTELAAGDRVRIETPGGGGWGTAEDDERQGEQARSLRAAKAER